MKRFVVLSFVSISALTAVACAPSGVGDPCIPEGEFLEFSGGSDGKVLSIDLNSVQCETRVCLSHYLKGRVSCPYGNNKNQSPLPTGATCKEVPGYSGLYTHNGEKGAPLCCPLMGDVNGAAVNSPVSPQCEKRDASDSVYCSCRCDVPEGIDKTTVKLCACPSGFKCKPLCNQTTGGCALLPKGLWGSYCVKEGAKGFDFDENTSQTAICSDAFDKKRPDQ